MNKRNIRKKRYIKYKKERVVLSDVLPYELPILFSNRYFYRFLLKYNVYIKNNIIFFGENRKNLTKTEKNGLPHIIKLLFGLPIDISIENNHQISISDKRKSKVKRTIPFRYKITHKEKEFRELAIIHPLNQLQMVDFYEKYKELILYACGRSGFSIRKPYNIAKYFYFKDKLHIYKRGESEDNLEIDFYEYENLKTFFSYKKYTNIHKFYESYHYQRAEKKYGNLLKFDIAQCFNSIYTHSISWALIGRNAVKDNLDDTKNTFGGHFDDLMCKMNYDETNGILIGPEFSRIFAEIILQRIDKNVEIQLTKEETPIIHHRDYVCFRYVDDYFVFFSDDSIKDKIFKNFKLALGEYKLTVSEAKTQLYSKPIITELTIAKLKIAELLEGDIHFRIEKDAFLGDIDIEDYQAINNDVFKVYVNSNRLAAKFKSILVESKVEYKEVLNYSLSIIERKIGSILNKFDDYFKQLTKLSNDGELDDKQIQIKYNREKMFTLFILNMLDYTFFLYNTYPRVNSTMKLIVILNMIITSFNKKYRIEKHNVDKFQQINIDLVLKKIQDEIILVLEKNKLIKETQVETLYLLIVLEKLGDEYKLSQDSLIKYFNISQDTNGKLVFNNHLNTLSILVLLYYIKNDIRYQCIKDSLQDFIKKKYGEIHIEKRRSYSELILLIMDILTCPYLIDDYKKELLALCNITDVDSQNQVIKFHKGHKHWFIRWTDFNLGKELNAKISQEVYS